MGRILALVTQWKAGDPSHYMPDDEETFLYVLTLLLPLGILFCGFSQWVYRSNDNTRRKLLWEPGEGIAFGLLFLWNFMVWLFLLEFLCPSVIRMNSLCSACIISMCLLIYFHKNCGQHWWITALCINTYPVINCKSTRCKLNKLIIGEVFEKNLYLKPFKM